MEKALEVILEAAERAAQAAEKAKSVSIEAACSAAACSAQAQILADWATSRAEGKFGGPFFQVEQAVEKALYWAEKAEGAART